MARYNSGFTIIETTLVLAITGLIIAVILTGIGNSLRHQRYTDAINQATDFFRGQFTGTANVVNERPRGETCSSGGFLPADPTAVGATPGTSECLLLGRIIRSTDGENISVSQIVALHDPTDDPNASDLTDRELLTAAQLRQGNEIQNYRLEWGTRLQQPGSDDSAAFTLLIVRTPISGTIRTFSSTSGTEPLTGLLSAPEATASNLRLCIDQTGFFGVGVAPMGIAVAKDATNTTGVQVIPSGDCV